MQTCEGPWASLESMEVTEKHTERGWEPEEAESL